MPDDSDHANPILSMIREAIRLVVGQWTEAGWDVGRGVVSWLVTNWFAGEGLFHPESMMPINPLRFAVFQAYLCAVVVLFLSHGWKTLWMLWMLVALAIFATIRDYGYRIADEIMGVPS